MPHPTRSADADGDGRLLRLGRTGQTLALNAVPALGFFSGEWTAGTTLVFYWLETVFLTVSVATLISLHRRRTRCAGHWIGMEFGQQGSGPTGPSKGRSLSDFLGVMIPFTFGHGFFVAMITFLGLPNMTGEPAPGWLELASGAAPALAFVAIGFALDRHRVETRSFAWIESTARSLVTRMIITHLTIIFGMMALCAMESPQGLLGVFFALKTAVDLARRIPKAAPSAPSKVDPWWVKWLDRWFPTQTDKTWAEDWQEHSAMWVHSQDERRQLIEDKERFVPQGRRAAAA